MNTNLNPSEKAEPKTDVKCRFFAHYYDQNVLMNNRLTLMGKHLISDDLDKYWLNLKSLLQITDEDAEFISKKIAGVTDEEYKLKEIDYIKKMLYKYLSDFKNTDSYIFDYLRSKGYATPYLEYSIEDLISLGWVQLS